MISRNAGTRSKRWGSGHGPDRTGPLQRRHQHRRQRQRQRQLEHISSERLPEAQYLRSVSTLGSEQAEWHGTIEADLVGNGQWSVVNGQAGLVL